MNFNEIKKLAQKSSFSIQLSSFEGMAMSVCESMQLGLIPIVTNVGEVKKYCKNLENCLIYSANEESLIKEIFELIDSEKYYMRIRKNSINTWSKSSNYKKDLLNIFNKLSS